MLAHDSFLTGLTEGILDHNIDVQNNERLDVVFENAMKQPREQAQKLRDVVLNLNDKMNALLESEKAEFLAAYRAHTKKIQEDLTRLRARVAEEEASFRKDEKVRQLQEDRDHFRGDALLLDSKTVAMKKQLIYMKSKLEAIEDDRNFLVRQLQGAKEKNDVVRAELTSEDGWDSGGTAQMNDRQVDMSEMRSASSMSTAELLDTLRASIYRTEDQLPQIFERIDSRNAASLDSRFASFVSSSASAPVRDKKKCGLKRELRAVQTATLLERREQDALTRDVMQLMQRQEKHWLEALFVECVSNIYKGIEKRRRTARVVHMKEEGPTQPKCNEISLHLEWFTAQDRVACLRIVLSDIRVQAALETRANISSPSPKIAKEMSTVNPHTTRFGFETTHDEGSSYISSRASRMSSLPLKKTQNQA